MMIAARRLVAGLEELRLVAGGRQRVLKNGVLVAKMCVLVQQNLHAGRLLTGRLAVGRVLLGDQIDDLV